MISDPKVFRINNIEIFAFNHNGKLIVLDMGTIYQTNYKANILGVSQETLIILVRNKYIISVDFPSFGLKKILFKGLVESHTCSHSSIWFLHQNIVYRIDSSMQVSLYDDFTHTRLTKINYLFGLNTLVFIVLNKEKLQIHFDNLNIPSLIFPNISSIPEIFFASEHTIIFYFGRSFFQFTVHNKNLQRLQETNPIQFIWKYFLFEINYKIVNTEVKISRDTHVNYLINGDIWKIFNAGDSIYLFSESINSIICIDKIDSEGHFSRIYKKKIRNYSINLIKSNFSPVLELFSKKRDKNHGLTAILFIHGGPHQKAGNLWDPLLDALLQKEYFIYIPQYPGTFGTENSNKNIINYGVDDYKDVMFHFKQIQQTHKKTIVVGHSYGAFLGLKIFLTQKVDIFFGINGIYDLGTISILNPKTYSHLSEKEKSARIPKRSTTFTNQYGEWHHIQYTQDPVIKISDLENSLNTIDYKKPKIHYFNFFGHYVNENQASQIAELIKITEQKFYNQPIIPKLFQILDFGCTKT